MGVGYRRGRKEQGTQNGHSNQAVPVLWRGRARERAGVRHVRQTHAGDAGRTAARRGRREDDVRLRRTAGPAARTSGAARSAAAGWLSAAGPAARLSAAAAAGWLSAAGP